MRTSEFHIQTLKETPSDAEIASHKLMLRSGMIRRLASGLYTWMPLGLKVLRKIEAIVREEMNKAGAVELLMPTIQPAELWQETGRWSKYGDELLRLTDRHHRDFCFGPTHEEIITDIARNELQSYKQLPVCFYQVQTKFRDERRPRFGVMRSREFLMKDAYSFHANDESLQITYKKMYDAYCKIFERCSLDFRPVQADSGSIGGDASHEFHVLAASGEDAIAFSDSSSYAANVELAPAIADTEIRPEPSETKQSVDTVGQHSIDSVAKFLNVDNRNILKTLIVKAEQDGVIALLLRGDHELNEIKAENHPLVASPLEMASDTDIIEATGCKPGSLGPIDLNIPVIADHSVIIMANFVCGANQEDVHFTGVNWERDLAVPSTIADLRNVTEGDKSPDGNGTLTIKRGIEVGHIFQLGKTYSDSMSATVLNENGKAEVMTMGCYGIGVSRVVAAAIEQNHDDKGIIWPSAIAPFDIAICPMNMKKSEAVREAAEQLYDALTKAGYDVLLDDRTVRPGFMFSDMELIGIPHRIVVGDRALKDNELEYKGRTDSDNQMVGQNDIMDFIREKLAIK